MAEDAELRRMMADLGAARFDTVSMLEDYNPGRARGTGGDSRPGRHELRHQRFSDQHAERLETLTAQYNSEERAIHEMQKEQRLAGTGARFRQRASSPGAQGTVRFVAGQRIELGSRTKSSPKNQNSASRAHTLPVRQDNIQVQAPQVRQDSNIQVQAPPSNKNMVRRAHAIPITQDGNARAQGPPAGQNIVAREQLNEAAADTSVSPQAARPSLELKPSQTLAPAQPKDAAQDRSVSGEAMGASIGLKPSELLRSMKAFAFAGMKAFSNAPTVPTTTPAINGATKNDASSSNNDTAKRAFNPVFNDSSKRKLGSSTPLVQSFASALREAVTAKAFEPRSAAAIQQTSLFSNQQPTATFRTASNTASSQPAQGVNISEAAQLTALIRSNALKMLGRSDMLPVNVEKRGGIYYARAEDTISTLAAWT